MRRYWHTQLPLFLVLCVFTAVMLTPVVWAVLTSFKHPVDAFAVPPELFFTPTFEFHYQVWVEKAFWHYLINSAVVSISTVMLSVSIGTMAAYGLSRLRSRASRGVLFATVADPNLLVAVQLLDGVTASVIGVMVPLMIADLTRGTGHFNLGQGIVGTMTGIGASLSTTVAGYASDHFGSAFAFLCLAGIATLGLATVALFMQETRPADEPAVA